MGVEEIIYTSVRTFYQLVEKREKFYHIAPANKNLSVSEGLDSSIEGFFNILIWFAKRRTPKGYYFLKKR